jgi:hypothetical protein
MSSCVYETYVGTVFGMVQLLPWVVPTFITVASFTKDRRRRAGFEFTPFWFSFYLSFWQMVLYILQISFHHLRADPFCSRIYSEAFPSITVFYTTCGVTFIVLFTFLWQHALNWKYCLYLLLFAIGPPAYLIWVNYNTPAEVAITVALAIVATAIYLGIVYFYMADRLPYVLNTVPCTWFGVTDNYLMSDEQEEKSEELRRVYEALDLNH